MDRIERHDVLNAAFLAVVLLGLALSFLYGARALLDAVNGDSQTVTAATTGESASGPVGSEERGSQGAAPQAPTTTIAEPTTTTTVPEATTTTAEIAHPPNEVVTRIGNGAQRGGIAGAGTAILQQAGYQALSPKNADLIERSVVYHQPGYRLDGVAVAALLAVAPENVLVMPENPGIPVNEAHVVVILGQDTTVG